MGRAVMSAGAALFGEVGSAEIIAHAPLSSFARPDSRGRLSPRKLRQKNPFYLTLLGCWVEGDFEVVEESIHPEKSGDG